MQFIESAHQNSEPKITEHDTLNVAVSLVVLAVQLDVSLSKILLLHMLYVIVSEQMAPSEVVTATTM